MSAAQPVVATRRGTLDPRLAWGVVVAALAPLGIGVLTDPVALLDPITWLVLGLIASLTVVGAIVASRVPHNRVGPLLLLAGLLMTLAVVLSAYREVASSASPVASWTAFLFAVQDVSFWYPILVTIVAVPLVFPGDQAATRREWIVGSALLVAMVAATIAVALSSPTLGLAGAENSLFAPAAVPLLEQVIPISLIVILASAAAAAWTLWQRFRGPDPVVRHQTKWLLATVAPAVVAIAISQAPVAEPVQVAGYFVALMATLAMPWTILVAILRYRLYDIDRIVSRTISWAVLTGVLAVVFVAGVIGLQAALDRFTQGETIAVAASTLLAFALFQPLRRRVQGAVDRRFDRSRVDAEQTAAAFAERLRGEVAIDAVADDLAATVAATMRPAAQGLWLRGAVR